MGRRVAGVRAGSTSIPTDFKTNSFYVNDRWQLNDKWSFNLGVRYDENDGRDAGGNLVTDDSKVSPRLAVSYDLKGDGDWVFNASYGTYVSAINNSIADSAATGGAIGRSILFYERSADQPRRRRLPRHQQLHLDPGQRRRS